MQRYNRDTGSVIKLSQRQMFLKLGTDIPISAPKWLSGLNMKHPFVTNVPVLQTQVYATYDFPFSSSLELEDFFY